MANKAPQEQPSEAREMNSMTDFWTKWYVNRDAIRGEAKGTCQISKPEARCVLQQEKKMKRRT